jgi:hypothetical protein
MEDVQTLQMTLPHDLFGVVDRITLEAEEDLGRHRFAHGDLTEVTGIRSVLAIGRFTLGLEIGARKP